MRYAWRSLLVIAVFLGVGYAVMHLVIAHSMQVDTPVSEIRLAGGMAGLFSGGAAACIVGVVLVRARRPEPRTPDV